MITYTFIGTTDDQTTCDLCGKSNLKRTVVLKTDEGDIVHYGVDCAAMALRKTGAKTTSRIVSHQADAVAYAQRLIAKGAYTLEQVATAVWNRYGYLTDTRGSVLLIGKFAEIAV